MGTRENRVIVGAFVCFLLAVVVVVYADRVLELPVDGPLVIYVLFAGIGIVGPQLYLATRDDDDVSARSRVRFAVLAALVLAVVFGGTDGWQERLVLGIGVVAYVGYVAHQLAAGYRTSARSAGQAEPQDG